MSWWKDSEAEEIINDMKDENNVYPDFEAIGEKDKGKRVGNNLYINDGTVEGFSKKSNFVHNTLKGKFLRPIIKYFMKKHWDKLDKKLPDVYQFEKLNLFSRAYDAALVDWNNKYRSISGGKLQSKDYIADRLKDYASEMMLFFKDSYITVCANDSAYLEFHNMLMLNLKKELALIDNQHLLFVDSNFNDPKYFVVVNQFTPETLQLAKHLVDGYIRCAEVVKNDDGTVSLKVWENKMPNFVKNTDLPRG